MMELNELKSALNEESPSIPMFDSHSLNTIQAKVNRFDKKTTSNTIIESLVATVAFILVVTAIINGHEIYPLVIDILWPSLTQIAEPKLNVMIYISLIFMAIYCLVIPIKLSIVNKNNQSINWTLIARIDNEIAKLESQSRLWSQAHLWFIVPSATIGMLFFWGL